ncbi:MAG: hypothetical protein KF689_02625 [Gemmatimonadaceae bacterium]|nr:hypothetical protein [Gemmatimonadaceae bacterium]MCW5826832.1 hypothetical protein [Gemmatimonadaceae bacterium]
MKHSFTRLALAVATLVVAACSQRSVETTPTAQQMRGPTGEAFRNDRRVGLAAGLFDAGVATSNMRIVGTARSPEGFLGITNSDLAFTGNYAIQGNYNGPVIWDISNPANPTVVAAVTCPASQNDVSVYGNLLFLSAEAFNGRTDCGTQAPTGQSNPLRFRGVRVFDISNIREPRLVAGVQTCRGSHTHTVVENPRDRENIYIYVSGSAPVRQNSELEGCINETPDKNPRSSLMKIEIIKVPLTNPAAAAIVNRADIFTGLSQPHEHGPTAAERTVALSRADSARAAGAFVVNNSQTGLPLVLGAGFIRAQLDSVVRARGGSGAPTGADSAALRAGIQGVVDRLIGGGAQPGGPVSPTSQCHDITVYPALGLAGGACEGHGLLLDISDPVNPVRIDAVADSNFAYWHSATFSNDGSKILFSDEWGGGGAPKCRATDNYEWGANAIFRIENRKMVFESYFKIPTIQTDQENCVAHNGSLVPVPGRDIMVQSWYQGGVSVFDWTDARNPYEIAFFDRGPVNANRMEMGGAWSTYWYNGVIVSSEIARGIDIAELTPSQHLTQNEIDAAKTVRFAEFNAQGQPRLSWPPSFALAKAYLDQAERNGCLTASRVTDIRNAISNAERATGSERQQALQRVAGTLDTEARNACDRNKIRDLQQALQNLAQVTIS